MNSKNREQKYKINNGTMNEVWARGCVCVCAKWNEMR